MSAQGFFITGTDTGVGKTVVACGLARAFRRQGLSVGVMKPVAAGAMRTPAGLRSEDAQALIEAAGTRQTYLDVNPYCFETPVSPHIAAEDSMIEVDCDTIQRHYQALAATTDRILVEGAGGWLTPVSRHRTMADVACALGVPVVLVVGLRLGCLNHAQLTRLAVDASGLSFAGWIASGIDPQMGRPEANLAALERLLGQPALAVIAHDPRAVAALVLEQAAARLAP